MAATARVLATYELLEAILHKLGTKDLLLAQRVSCDWHGIISRSHKLQRALFFLPAGGLEQELLKNQVIFPKGDQGTWSCDANSLPMLVHANPLLNSLHALLKEESVVDKERILHPAWQRPEASWRRMQLSQPQTVAHIVFTYRSLGPEFRDSYGTYADPGEGEVLRADDLLTARKSSGVPARRPWGQFLDGISSWKALEDNEQIEETTKGVHE